MNKIEEIARQLDYARHGEERLRLLKMAYEEADAMHDYDNQMFYRMEFMKESDFYFDAMEMYVVFPKLLQLHDSYLEVHGYNPYTFDVMWRYKWILGNAEDFYQISLKQMDYLLEDFRRRCLEYGYSLRTYYRYVYAFFQYIDWGKAEEAYQKYLMYDRDELSDCKACELNLEVEYLLATDREEQAIKRATVLMSRQLQCAEVPEATCGHFLRFYNLKLCTGEAVDLEATNRYCDLLRNGITKKGICAVYLGDVLLFYSLTNSAKALNWFKKYWEVFETSRNPAVKFHFALGTLKFLEHLKDQKTYKMKLSSEFPLYQESGEYQVQELYQYYNSYAVDFARKLDQRNQSSYYMDIYDKVVGK